VDKGSLTETHPPRIGTQLNRERKELVDSKRVSDRAHPADYRKVEGAVWRPDRRLTRGAGLVVILLLSLGLWGLILLGIGSLASVWP
jgi:hypothetical protein